MTPSNKYSSSSPYYLTDTVNGQFLDVMINRPLIIDPSDIYWQITPVYNLRPDLLAHDLYENSKLWWVFAKRNPNKLKDPLFDFTTGTYIFIPTIDLLKSQLGV